MSDLACHSTDMLQMGTIAHPADATAAGFFRDWRSACDHLSNHLLTAPECGVWLHVLPRQAELLGGSYELRRCYADQSLATAGVSAQELYDEYRAATSADAGDARRLEWYIREGSFCVALGTSGILMMLERDTVTTAYLSGQGDPEATKLARKETTDAAPLRRDRGMRSGRPGKMVEESARDSRARARRAVQWTELERLYYEVFRPAVQHIRKQHHQCRDLRGKLVRNDKALLKPVLPPLSQLKFDQWLTHRQGRSQVEHGGN